MRVSTLTPQEREELVKAKQKEISSFLKHAAVGSSYEIWTAMQEFDADALGHYKKIR